MQKELFIISWAKTTAMSLTTRLKHNIFDKPQMWLIYAVEPKTLRPKTLEKLVDLATNKEADIDARYSALKIIESYYSKTAPDETPENLRIGTSLFYLSYEEKHPERIRTAAYWAHKAMGNIREGWTYGQG